MAYEQSTFTVLDKGISTRYTPDPVNAPEHYLAGRTIEPIAVIEDWKLDYHLGNALKYISRAGRKDSMKQDLEKCIWYIKRKMETYATD